MPDREQMRQRWLKLLSERDGVSRGLIIDRQPCPFDEEPGWLPDGVTVWEPVLSPEEPQRFDCLVLRDLVAETLAHDGRSGGRNAPVPVALLNAAARAVRLGKPILVHTAGRFAELKQPASTQVSPFELNPAWLLAGEELVYLLQVHCELPVPELEDVSATYLTPIERRLASALDEAGIDFRVQVPIGAFVVDFLIGESLVIECDGEAWHDPATDERRDVTLRGLGYRVLRFTGRSLFHSVGSCVDRIREALRHETPTEYREVLQMTDAQRRAVSHSDGPALVVAPAGSGKTRVIEERVRWLISSGVDPARICVVSFSRAAVGEVQDRLASSPEVSIKTVNALGNEIVTSSRGPQTLVEAHRDPRRPTRRKIAKEAAARAGYRPEPHMFDVSALVDAIGNYRESLSLPDSDDLGVWLDQDEGESEAACNARRQEMFLRIHAQYESALREDSLIDFSGQVLEAIRILASDWRRRLQISQSFDYWLIDEFQDLAPPKIMLVRMLVAPARNLMVVGDDDQMIYGFAGAQAQSFSSLDRDWPDVTALPLDRNFRSPHELVVRSRWLIERNRERIPKDTRPHLELSETPSVSVVHEGNYARAAVDEFEKLRRTRPISDFAFLFRTAMAAGPVELLLESRGIPFHPIAKYSVVRNPTIKWVLSWLRVVNEPRASGDDWEQVLRRPTRYLTRNTRAWIATDLDPFALLQTIAANGGRGLLGLSPKQTPEMVADSLGELVRVIDAARRFPDSLEFQLRQLNLLETLEVEQRRADEDPSKATAAPNMDGNSIDPLTAYRIFALMADLAGTWERLEAFLADAETDADIDLEVRPSPESGEGVVLSTIHRFKGKECDVVFVLGPSEGYMPDPRATSPAAREEERRVAYVAATRARKMLYFWCSAQFQEELSTRADGLTWDMYAAGVRTPPQRPTPPAPPIVPERNPPRAVNEDDPGLLELALRWLTKWLR